MPTPADMERAKKLWEVLIALADNGPGYSLEGETKIAAEFEAVRKERDEYWEARIKEIYAGEIK